MPALVNGARVAYDPVTGQSLNPIFIGAYVPGTGNEANGMVQADRPRACRRASARCSSRRSSRGSASRGI